jgi:hypothetical protein
VKQQTVTIPRRTVGEWALESAKAYDNPFGDVALEATFTGPSGRSFTIPGFYDGDGTWRVRFNPNEVGRWTYATAARPADPHLAAEGAFEVTANEALGTLVATPGRAWGFCYESGEPAFLLGDTVYNLFGMAHCGGDVQGYLRHRAGQGFNLFRVRFPVSPYHPPEGYSEWQTRRTWPWGGSEQKPLFDRFNLDYFRTVDRVIQWGEELGVGFEAIMEAWGFEYPFNDRSVFLPEWEALWMRYLIARYDAYNCLYFWTPMNEYEYYPDGDWRYNPVADRWAMRVGRWIKGVGQHGHVVAVHNGPRMPPFAQRFAADPGAIDAIMFQEWGDRGAEGGWLAAGIEEQIWESLAGWPGSAVFAEYGYERNPELPLNVPGHKYCDVEHTRRGAWRGAFCALGVIHGFENSWGPFMVLDRDQSGLAALLHLRRFFTDVVPYDRLRPAPQVVAVGEYELGCQPQALATDERDVVAVYFPALGTVGLDLPLVAYDGQWYDPRTGEQSTAWGDMEAGLLQYVAPLGFDEHDHPCDWVLVLRKGGM